MNHRTPYKKYMLLGILLYGIIITGLNLNYSAITHDEAISIYMGRAVLNKQYCALCLQNTGSIMIQPFFITLGDLLAGLEGARIIGILFGIGLTIIIYQVSLTLFSQELALISAFLFICTGLTIYLMKLATYDIYAAFFLGLSLLFLFTSEKKHSFYISGLWLTGCATALFLASITKYTLAVFIPAFLIYILFKHKFSKGLIFFIFPLTVFLSLYIYLALLPAWGHLAGSMISPYKEGKISYSILANRVLEWLALPYLLTVFGLFHKKWGKTALLLFFLSTPVVLLHIISGDGRSLIKNVFYSIVILTPASALGVDKMVHLFSSNLTASWIKPFFLTMVIFVFWTFGIYQLKWLEKQYPDASPVISFFEKNGSDEMKVIIDSKYGEPDYIYRYSLEEIYPNAQFYSTSHLTEQNKVELFHTVNPHYIVFEEFYSGKQMSKSAKNFIRNHYAIYKKFTLPLSWGKQNIEIYRRETS